MSDEINRTPQYNGQDDFNEYALPSSVRTSEEVSVGLQKKADAPGNGDDNQKKRKKRKRKGLSRRARRTWKAIICIFMVILLTGSTIVGFVAVNMYEYVNGDLAIDLSEYKENQSQTTIVYAYDSDGELVELARLHGEENRLWVSIDDVSEYLQYAFIALEDKRFMTHSGVDWISTINVVLLEGFSRGGSTITQQLIKNLTGESGRTFIRKYREILNALNLEKNYSKETILECYLNTIYLDAGCYGVEAAAEYYFGKEASELNLAECACLAAITKAPRAYNPILNYDTNRERMLYCLSEMLSQGYITQEEYDEAVAYDLVFTTDDDYVASDSDSDTTADDDEDEEEEEYQSYYVDYVIETVIEDFQTVYGYSYTEAWRKVYYGGLKIYTAVDLEVQEIMEDVYYNRTGFPTGTNSYGELVQSCMTIMDYEGRVVGIVGQAGEKTGNRVLNYATDSPRQPGSAIKPLSVYSLAIESGEFTWSTLVQNYGILLSSGERWPTNYGGDSGSESSYVTIQAAIAPSLNTVPAQLVKYFGVETVYNWLEDTFKLTTLTEADMDYSPLAVGGMEYGVTSLELTAAYAVFGNGGLYYEPWCYYKVTNGSGSTIYLAHTDTAYERVLSEGGAYVMNKLLQTVVTASNGTASSYKVSGFTTFAKTGTTTNNKDRWFVGGTPYYVASVWFGFADHAEDMTDIISGNPAGSTFKLIMDAIHENLEAKEFETTDEAVQLKYCTVTGLIASSDCSDVGYGWYKTDAIPSTCTTCTAALAAEEEEDDADSDDSDDTDDTE